MIKYIYNSFINKKKLILIKIQLNDGRPFTFFNCLLLVNTIYCLILVNTFKFVKSYFKSFMATYISDWYRPDTQHSLYLCLINNFYYSDSFEAFFPDKKTTIVFHKCLISPFHVFFLFTAGWSVHFMFCFYLLPGDQSLLCFVSSILQGDQSLSCFVSNIYLLQGYQSL